MIAYPGNVGAPLPLAKNALCPAKPWAYKTIEVLDCYLHRGTSLRSKSILSFEVNLLFSTDNMLVLKVCRPNGPNSALC